MAKDCKYCVQEKEQKEKGYPIVAERYDEKEKEIYAEHLKKHG